MKKLDRNIFTAIVVFGISIIGFLSTIFLISGEHKDIPLGFIYSGVIISILYLATYFLSKLDEKKQLAAFSIASITIRLVVTITALLIAALMYYRWNLPLFNIFVFIGVYTVGALTFILSHIIKRKE